MNLYYVNRQEQSNGDHEVHVSTCSFLPSPQNQQALGYHNNCFEAVRAAKVYYPRSNGCYWCCRECHTS